MLGLALSACGVPEDSSPRSLDVEDLARPQDVPQPEAELVLRDPNDEFLTIYFDRGQDDLKISEVLRFASQPVMPEDILAFLLEGPSEEETEQGFVSYLPKLDDLQDTRLEGDVFVVNFRKGSRLEDISGLQLYLAAGQLVLSLVDNSSLEGIRVEIEGYPVALPSEEGDLTGTARRDDYDDLLESQSVTLGELLSPPPFPPAPDESSDRAYLEENFLGEDLSTEVGGK